MAVCGKAGKEQSDAAAQQPDSNGKAANTPAAKAAAAKGDNAASVEARAAARLTQVCSSWLHFERFADLCTPQCTWPYCGALPAKSILVLKSSTCEFLDDNAASIEAGAAARLAQVCSD